MYFMFFPLLFCYIYGPMGQMSVGFGSANCCSLVRKWVILGPPETLGHAFQAHQDSGPMSPDTATTNFFPSNYFFCILYSYWISTNLELSREVPHGVERGGRRGIKMHPNKSDFVPKLEHETLRKGKRVFTTLSKAQLVPSTYSCVVKK